MKNNPLKKNLTKELTCNEAAGQTEHTSLEVTPCSS